MEGIRSKVWHSNQMGKLKEHREAFINAGADLFFLSAGERQVSLKSGFAELANYFGGMPHKVTSVEQCVEDSVRLGHAIR